MKFYFFVILLYTVKIVKNEQNAINYDILLKTTSELIVKHGYRAEAHMVVSEDGYLLTIHRVLPKKIGTKLNKTALLYHGLALNSASWVFPGPERSLPYILSDAGYDVWMGNSRGTIYSRRHISKPSNSKEFWDFSWHDASINDLTSVANYIRALSQNKTKIHYIGHSMGTTQLFSLLSTKTEYNDIFKAGYALAPVAYMTHIKSPFSFLSKYVNSLDYIFKILGVNQLNTEDSLFVQILRTLCLSHMIEKFQCENILFLISGFDKSQFNMTLLPLIEKLTPDGISTKTLVHFAQIIANRGIFQKYDYGEKNFETYGQSTPPEYPVHEITLPIALFSAENDWLASVEDSDILYSKLSNPITHYTVPYKEFNHMDFLWGIDAPELIYSKLIDVMEKQE